MSGGLSRFLFSAIMLAGAPAFAAAGPPAALPLLAVAQWRWTASIDNRQPMDNYQSSAPAEPLYFWFELHGSEAAVDALKAGRRLRVVVRWHRENGATPGAPDLVSVLPIGEPGLADRLAHEVREQGYFDWPAWARKDTLSPGRWTVSLTDPDGYPLPCAAPQGACRFTIDIG
jgi:hypothetical protein